MTVKERILKYGGIVGVSSQEQSMAKYLCEELNRMGISSYMDTNGNVHGRITCNHPDAKTLLLEAHLDQIGLLVSSIDKDGMLQFTALGGVDERILYGMEIEVDSNPPLFGVVGAIRAKDEEKNVKIEDLRIDLGLPYDEVIQRVHVGDVVAFKNVSKSLLGSLSSGCSMDNRAGVASIMDCLTKVKHEDLPYHLEVLFSTGEELGLQGAYTGTKLVDAAIVVDVTFGITPDNKEAIGLFPLGCGAVICRGPCIRDDYAKQLICLAQERKIRYDIEASPANTGTNTWAIQTTGTGIPVMLISIPLRYMHSNIETLSLEDVQAVSDLLYAAIIGGVNLDA